VTPRRFRQVLAVGRRQGGRRTGGAEESVSAYRVAGVSRLRNNLFRHRRFTSLHFRSAFLLATLSP
jgi:hypothetical protein